MLLYAIDVENVDTGDRQDWLWNQTASSPEEALRLSDDHLSALGWPHGWRSVKARAIADGIVANPGPDAIVETILPGTLEWEMSEIALERQRRMGG